MNLSQYSFIFFLNFLFQLPYFIIQIRNLLHLLLLHMLLKLIIIITQTIFITIIKTIIHHRKGILVRKSRILFIILSHTDQIRSKINTICTPMSNNIAFLRLRDIFHLLYLFLMGNTGRALFNYIMEGRRFQILLGGVLCIENIFMVSISMSLL